MRSETEIKEMIDIFTEILKIVDYMKARTGKDVLEWVLNIDNNFSKIFEIEKNKLKIAILDDPMKEEYLNLRMVYEDFIIPERKLEKKRDLDDLKKDLEKGDG